MRVIHRIHSTYDDDETPVKGGAPTTRVSQSRVQGRPIHDGPDPPDHAVSRLQGVFVVRGHRQALVSDPQCPSRRSECTVKFRVERDVLAEAVTWVARGLPARPPVPVLAGVLVDANPEGTLTLSAFDYEVSARVTVAADVSDGGTVLVSGRLLADISRNLPNKPVDVIAEGPKVAVTCGSSRFSLLTMPVDDYPTLPQMPQASGSVSGDVFTLAVGQVTVAAGRDDTLPILTGVRLEIDGSRITMLATDRYRLAMRTLDWSPEGADAAAVALVPARTLADTARALGASEI